MNPCCRGVSVQGVGSTRCREVRRGCGLPFLSCEKYPSAVNDCGCVLRLTQLGHGSRHSTGVKVISSIASDLTCFYHHFEHGSGAFVLTCGLCLGYGLTGACDWRNEWILVLWSSEMATATADVVQQQRKGITLKIARLEEDKAKRALWRARRK